MTTTTLYRLFDIPVLSELDLPLPAIRAATTPSAESIVTVVLAPVEASGDAVWISESPIPIACFRRDGATILAWSGARFCVTPDLVVVDSDAPDVAVSLLLHAVWSVVLSARRQEALHGCAVERHGGAIAILGASGSGKTSAGLALLDRGWRLVADDLVTLDAAGRVAPGPPFVRLLPDQAIGRTGELDAFGKVRVRPAVCSTAAPLTGIIVHVEEQTEVRRLVGAAAVDAVLTHRYNDAIPFPGQAQRCFELALDLADRVPIYGAPPRSLTVEQLDHVAYGAVQETRRDRALLR